MILLDQLRPPLPFDPTRAAYKDWLHLNVFDKRSGSVGLVNMSLHGAPDDQRARAIGTALVHAPRTGWLGNAEVLRLSEATLSGNSITMRSAGLSVDYPNGRVLASVQMPDDGLQLRLTAHAETPAIDFDQQLPLGPGWVAWYVVPLLSVSGTAVVGGRQLSFDTALAYHDHNWGRWHWGDDLGWDWGTFVAPPSFVCVVARTTDQSHRRVSSTLVIVSDGNRRRIFRGPAVNVGLAYSLRRIDRRLPGAMAALHQDRRMLRLPQQLTLTADDGLDRLSLQFEATGIAQLIAADPMQRGYGFVNEIAGTFRGSGLVAGHVVDVEGLGIVEHVA